MDKLNSEKGGITLFVIVALLFAVTILIVTYWRSTNYQVSVLQSEQRIKEIYGKDVNNVNEIYDEVSSVPQKGPTGKPLVNKVTISDYVTGTNFEGEDRYGNPITIPVGFKVAQDSGADVTQGIVIEDNDIQTDGNGNQRGNQYVWIPTGTIYTDTAMTPANAKTIVAGRYEFANGTNNYINEDGTTTTTAPAKGTPILKQRLSNYLIQPTDITYYSENMIKTATNKQIVVGGYYYEVPEYREGVEASGLSGQNRTAYSLSSFANSVADNRGFYIARYEASWGTGDKVKSRVSSGTPLTTNDTRTNGQLWNFITEIDAAEFCNNLYSNVESDLMNSYAWDTAIVYIQTFSGDEDYSYQTSLNIGSNPSNTGINNDEVCKINDIASNGWEWTTEYSTHKQNLNNIAFPCVLRGGFYVHENQWAGNRWDYYATYIIEYVTFRPILYL